MSSHFFVQWSEDGDATVLGRITSRAGSVAATGIDGEGNWLEQADVASITCSVFDLDSDTPDTPITTPTVIVSTSVLDTPVTVNTLWTVDTTGYNFIHDLAATNFPTGSNRYSVEYAVSMTNGGKFHAIFEGIARPIRSS